MSLQTKIVRGKQKLPKRLMVHGAPGVGKSTFSAGAEDVLFIDPERRTSHLDVARIEPDSWEEILPLCTEILQAKACKTLVFSTIDYIEGMVWKHLCKKGGVTSIKDVGGGWGAGYIASESEFKRLSNFMEAARNVGITCVLEAHSSVRELKNPIGDNYDVWQISLHERVKKVLTQRCDAIGFATFEDFAKKKKDENKAKAVTTGERVLKFDHHPAYETKRGFDLPESMPLVWSAWQAAVDKSFE